MGRSGYSDDWDDGDGRLGLWRGTVERAIRGKRGRAFLVEMAAALDAMPVKELHADVLVKGGQVCAIGAVAVARGVDVSKVDPYDRDDVAATFGISPALAAEIEFENDDEFRWSRQPATRSAYRGRDVRQLRQAHWGQVPMRPMRKEEQRESDGSILPPEPGREAAQGQASLFGVPTDGPLRDAVPVFHGRFGRGLPTREECIEAEQHGERVNMLCEWSYCGWCGLMLTQEEMERRSPQATNVSNEAKEK